MLWLVPADRVHSRREFYSSSRQCGTKPPARRDPLQCLGKFLRQGYTTAERLAAPRANAVPRPPARWDPLPRFGQCLRKWANSHCMGYLCLLPGGAAWRSLALREGIQRGHQHVRGGNQSGNSGNQSGSQSGNMSPVDASSDEE